MAGLGYEVGAGIERSVGCAGLVVFFFSLLGLLLSAAWVGAGHGFGVGVFVMYVVHDGKGQEANRRLFGSWRCNCMFLCV
jgi:hypothetical protein